ncbi:hypothetical protein DMP23_47050 [Amycolatopsis sp. A1MSW2902]|uniref:hypothetical protein n=1 Tax=Amycolatopsis sp. A1MSW2902 TaxID=687413 RepID=UPI00307FBBB2
MTTDPGASGPDDGSARARARREIRLTAGMLAEIVRRPSPEPVLYLRCDGGGYVTPEESVCPLRGAASPRVVGDQLGPANPAAGKTSASRC